MGLFSLGSLDMTDDKQQYIELMVSCSAEKTCQDCMRTRVRILCQFRKISCSHGERGDLSFADRSIVLLRLMRKNLYPTNSTVYL